jgi:hypothetical protein|tara:strand:- start:522 stop:677 length:156 start_codon:yes stop_codon:yes gene_type:complete
MDTRNKKLDNVNTFSDDDIVNIEDGNWDYYSGLPNPKWYDTSDDQTEGDEG